MATEMNTEDTLAGEVAEWGAIWESSCDESREVMEFKWPCFVDGGWNCNPGWFELNPNLDGKEQQKRKSYVHMANDSQWRDNVDVLDTINKECSH